MRTIKGLLLTFGLGLLISGCTHRSYTGKTVDQFVGRVTHNGQPVNFPADLHAQIAVFHEKGQQWSIPLKEDGTFDIGWMPVGKYVVMLVRQQGARKKGPGVSRYNVPGGLTIEDGKTHDYVIELGKGFKP
jgi:hypothetical protein